VTEPSTSEASTSEPSGSAGASGEQTAEDQKPMLTTDEAAQRDDLPIKPENS
jgi:hypothetical protein